MFQLYKCFIAPLPVANLVARQILHIFAAAIILIYLNQGAHAAEIALSPLEIDFGTTGVNSRITRELTVHNSGNDPLVITSLSLDGTDSGEFSLTVGGGSSPCTSLTPTLSANASCSIVVNANPQTIGIKAAILHVGSNAISGEAQMPLSVVSDNPAITITIKGTGSGSVQVGYVDPITSVQSSSACSGACVINVLLGSEVLIVAEQGPNSLFSGWHGCSTESSGTCLLTAGHDANVNVYFRDSQTNSETLNLIQKTDRSDYSHVKVNPSNINKVTVSGPSGIIHSENAEAESPVFSYIPSVRIFARLVMDPVDSNRLYAGRIKASTGESNFIYESTDSGKTFSATSTTDNINDITVNPNDHLSVYALGSNALYRKTGVSWPAVSMTGIAAATTNTIEFSPGGKFYAGTTSGLFTSSDNGATWNAISLNGSRNVIRIFVHPSDENTIFLDTGTGSLVSRNGGATWTALPTPLTSFNVMTADTDGADALYAGTGGNGIFLSHDKGVTWTSVNSLPGILDIALIPGTTPQALYATADQGLFQHLFKSAPIGLALLPLSHNFGSMDTTSLPLSQEFEITNKGINTITVNSITLSGGGSSSYAVVHGATNSCINNLPAVLGVGGKCTVSVNFAPATIGSHQATLKISSNDQAYPVIGVPLSGAATAVPPAGSITILGKTLQNGRQTVTSRTVTASLSASDSAGPSGLQLRTSANGRSWTSWLPYTQDMTLELSLTDGDGPKNLYVQYRNAAGAVSKPFSDFVTLETKAPVAAISPQFPLPLCSGQSSSNLGTVTFTLSADEPVQRYQCSIDGMPYSECISQPAFVVAHGQHTLSVKAVDLYDKEGDIASFAWFADRQPPHSSITSAPVALVDAVASFSFVADEQATFDCRIDARNFALCISGQTFSNLSTGAHTFDLRAKDCVGNLEDSVVQRSFSVSTLKKVELKIIGSPDLYYYDDTIRTILRPLTSGEMRLLTATFSEDVTIQNISTLKITGGYQALSPNDTPQVGFYSLIIGNVAFKGGSTLMSQVSVKGSVSIENGSILTADKLVIL